MQPPQGMNKSDSFITFKEQVIKMKNITKKSADDDVVKKVTRGVRFIKIKIGKLLLSHRST